MPTPQIAIIGRPNVGKSTFFNRVLSKRHAIVDPKEGITRDRIYGETEWCGQDLKFIDKESAIAARRDMDGVEILEKVITVSFACVVKNEIKKDEDLNRRVGVKKVRMRDITFGRRDLKKKNKNKKK